MAATTDQSDAGDLRQQKRDRWTAFGLLLSCWVLFAAMEQNPFKLQGAVLEALVERGRLHFVRGQMNGIMFENLDTNTPSFRHLFNVFPHGGLYHVNHAPGQFLLAAPWYAACVALGWRFETHERLVWRVLVWTLTAPLGALAAMCLFVLARHWRAPLGAGLLASTAFALASPWWPAAGVLYHDGLAVALVLIGATIWQCRFIGRQMGAIGAPLVAGFLLAFSIVTTYLLAPIVVVLCASLLASRSSRRDLFLFGAVFLLTVSLLPIANLIAFGSPFATGYSVGGFDKNYPAPLDLANAWEKTSFYLWDSNYGLLRLFPIFFVGGVGLIAGPSIAPELRKLLLALMTVHFLFIISMEHHGSVGWGMGRFFMPLYPILALGLTALWDQARWKGHILRALMFAALIYSAVFAFAGVSYGVQGVMEPGVPPLKLRFMFDHYELYQGLFWLALIGGVLGALLYPVFHIGGSPVARNQALQGRRKMSESSNVAVAATSRRRRKKP
jgi:hypothetical protein